MSGLASKARPADSYATTKRRQGLSYMEQKEYILPFTGVFMLVLDPPLLLALATLIGSVSSLVWTIRRKR